MNRVNLDAMLRAVLGSSNVYYQPPASLRLQYPCIVYSLAGAYDTKANNRTYRRIRRYSVIYITKDPDDPMLNKLDDLQYCSLERSFTSDNLYHFVYNIYYN